MTLATQPQWAQAIQSAQREHESRLRKALGDSLTQAKTKAGEIYDSRLSAIKENVPELKKQGVRTVSAFGAAFAFGAARGAFGDEKLMVKGMPIELLVGIGAHALASTALAGTPAALVAHGAGDAMLGASAAMFGRSLGGWIRERSTAANARLQQGATAGYAPHALPPGYEHALPAYAGAAPSVSEADRAMAEAIEIMRAA
jgi:hypothetical protein